MEWEMHQWMKGSREAVQKAIMLTWTSISKSKISCILEVYEQDFGDGVDEVVGGRMIQQEVRN
jgi:hypothetical protein